MLSWQSRPELETAAQELTPEVRQFAEALAAWWVEQREGKSMPVYSHQYSKFFDEKQLTTIVTNESRLLELLSVITFTGTRESICDYIITHNPKIITSANTLSKMQSGLTYDGITSWWRIDHGRYSDVPESTKKQFDNISKPASILNVSMFPRSDQRNIPGETPKQTL